MAVGRTGDERVAIVVLSYDGRQDTLACLESLKHSDWEPATTLVVDNGSTDGTAEAVRGAFPEATVLETHANLGFAEGNNVGIRRALELGADHVLLLNNDATVEPGTIRTLVDEARRRPGAGALCPLILFVDPPGTIWYAGASYDPRRAYNGGQDGYGEPEPRPPGDAYPVGRLSGAAVLVPAPVIERVGMLDADLFLHVEDVEWSLRMRAADLSLWVVPRARVLHHVSMATGGEHSPTLAYYGARNTLAVGDRHSGTGRARAAWRHLATVAVHLAHARRARHPLQNAAAVLEGWRDFRRGRQGPRGQSRPTAG